MKKWTDTAIQRSIDDLIEESFLMALSEDAVRDYLSNFVTACESVIRRSASIHGDIRLTKVKITLLRSYLYLNRKVGVTDRKNDASGNETRNNNLFAHNVVKIKSTTLRLLETIDRSYVEAVLEEEKKRREKTPVSAAETVKTRLIHESLYFLLLFSTLSLLFATVLF